jgi:hypothetical protein
LNIKIQVSKLSLDYDPIIEINFAGLSQVETIDTMQKTICLNTSHEYDTKLIISRKQTDLYSTGFNYHVNKVTIERVLLDNFWELTKTFYTPISICDQEYIDHFKRVDEGNWLDDVLPYNTTLFFNGSLQWDIKYPVRRSFYKDINR